jgi:hypothetical protein
MENMRGQPSTSAVTQRIQDVWCQVPEISFVRFMSNVLACTGVRYDNVAEVLFSGLLDDASLMKALGAYERLLKP